jgi:hypothetical protein
MLNKAGLPPIFVERWQTFDHIVLLIILLKNIVEFPSSLVMVYLVDLVS